MMERFAIALVFIVLFAATAKAQDTALTTDEIKSFRAQVSACWNVGRLSEKARKASVRVTMQMTRDAKPVGDSLRMVRSNPTPAQQETFQAARRAILRCGGRGYKLPLAKYDQWKNIEMTFDPERTRLK